MTRQHIPFLEGIRRTGEVGAPAVCHVVLVSSIKLSCQLTPAHADEDRMSWTWRQRSSVRLMPFVENDKARTALSPTRSGVACESGSRVVLDRSSPVSVTHLGVVVSILRTRGRQTQCPKVFRTLFQWRVFESAHCLTGRCTHGHYAPHGRLPHRSSAWHRRIEHRAQLDPYESVRVMPRQASVRGCEVADMGLIS